MQCNAPCLYQVCEAGSNGSWCGRVRESCSALGRRLAIEGCVASHGTKTATNNKVLASVSLSLCVSLSPLHLKSHPQTVMDWEKDDGGDESTTTLDQITLGLAQPLCNELTSSKSTSQHAEMFRFLFCYLLLLFFFCDNHDALLSGMLWWLQDCVSQLHLRPI